MYRRIFFTLSSFSFIAAIVLGARPALAQSRYSGRIYLQVEAQGEAWYVNPADETRYYLGRPTDAFNIMRTLGVGITNEDLARIPEPSASWDGDAQIMPYARGKIMLQVEEHGEAWYVNPTDGKRYYLGRPDDAFTIMSGLGIGITDHNLATIPISGSSMNVFSEEPDPFMLAVPFMPQAPHANWGKPYDESCEEAILVMLDHYYRGENLSAEEADRDILELVDWQMRTYGFYEDTGVHLTGRMAQDNYGWNFRISYHVTREAILEELQRGYPVILPVSGQDLGNPHFRSPGPIYHMLMVIGYEHGQFITHDPGTRYGADYRYDADTLISAVHDLTTPESAIRTGRPVYLVIEP